MLGIMLPIENERKERLLSIKAIEEPAADVLPIAFSLVLASHSSGFLLVRNTKRNVWELPGGFIDAGESARQCAARELEEESGQKAVNLRWRAALELEVQRFSTTRISYGALYCADIGTILPFTANSEVAEIDFWPTSNLPAGISAIDKVLLNFYA